MHDRSGKSTDWQEPPWLPEKKTSTVQRGINQRPRDNRRCSKTISTIGNTKERWRQQQSSH
ncbi:hypothetical protein DL93DRAFT_2091110 [Clavulina sp. PMI_390]|nr:hypothetical protein DL93DRAFT_2092027 [Clavulina sp. PMI_390]KAF8299658.1 hypothetical protein DL93DRAFT_2091110 [Clavulina sp. PMI_390]